MTPQQELVLAILYRALAEPYGLVVWSSDGDRFVQRCYVTRIASQDPELDKLQFLLRRLGPGEVAICKAIPSAGNEKKFDKLKLGAKPELPEGI